MAEMKLERPWSYCVRRIRFSGEDSRCLVATVHRLLRFLGDLLQHMIQHGHYMTTYTSTTTDKIPIIAVHTLLYSKYHNYYILTAPNVSSTTTIEKLA